MIVATQPLAEERDERRARLEPWRCDGALSNGRPCHKLLMELDKSRPSFIRKVCERCGHTNLFVEGFRAFKQ